MGRRHLPHWSHRQDARPRDQGHLIPYPEGFDGVAARYITLASGLRVRVVESGLGHPRAIILVPGWGCGAWVFHETLVPLAAAGFHAIAVELKGHGLSDKPPDEREYSVEAMRDHLAQILDALEIGRCGLVGHSMGAAIAAQAARASPERISGLVLAAPVGFHGVKFMSFFRMITPNFAIPLLRLVATRTLVRLMLSVVYGSLRKASAQDAYEFHAPVKTPGFIRALRNLLHAFDWDQAYPEPAVATMAIVGTEDILSPARDASKYPGKAVVIEKAGHVLFSEAPRIVNGALIRFFDETGAPYISIQHDQVKI